LRVAGENLGVTLSTTDLAWTNPASNPGFCGEMPATNDLSHCSD